MGTRGLVTRCSPPWPLLTRACRGPCLHACPCGSRLPDADSTLFAMAPSRAPMSRGARETHCLARVSPAYTVASGLQSCVQEAPCPATHPLSPVGSLLCPQEASGSGLSIQTPSSSSGCQASQHLGDDAAHGPHLPPQGAREAPGWALPKS